MKQPENLCEPSDVSRNSNDILKPGQGEIAEFRRVFLRKLCMFQRIQKKHRAKNQHLVLLQDHSPKVNYIMGSMNDITRGSTLRFNDQLWEVTDHLHARTGQRKPTVWTKLKNLRTGKVIENQFRSTDKVDFVRIESKDMEYLYRDGNNYVFMNQETYEQPAIPSEMVEGILPFLKEGTVCDFRYDDETIVGISLPDVIEVEVVDAPPHVRGDTATNDYRPVTIETGTEIKVPPFIQQGEKIKIDTRSGEYIGRVKA